MRTRICFFLMLSSASFASAPPDASLDPVVIAVQKVLPAVVNISTERVVEFSDPFEDVMRRFFGQPRGGSQSLGSGVIVDEDGWIITNWHVVRRATKINVTLANGTAYEARFVSGSESNDLALLKIEPKQPLAFIELAGASEPLLGETVIAIGNPFGFDHTVTRGIISAKNRKYPPDDPKFEDVLQTDAAINPGNSGGPLINTRGQLIGINSAILIEAQGIGFAIPAKRAANLLAAWFSPEKRARLWLGLRFTVEDGRIVVADVQADSPAAKAGAQTHDHVVAVAGESFNDLLRLQRALIHHKSGDTVKFELERDGKSITVSVKLAALPVVSVPDLMLQRFGLQVQELTADLAGAMGVSVSKGLLVADVLKASPAFEAGFRRGIVITHLGGEEVLSMDRLSEQLADVKAGDTVTMAVLVSERRGNVLFQRTTTVSLRAR